MKKYSYHEYVDYVNQQARFAKKVDYTELISMPSMHWKQCPGYHLAMRELARKALLNEHSHPSYDQNPLKKGSVLVAVGNSVFKQKALRERLADLGIKLGRTINEKTTHVLLNSNPSTTKGLENHSCTLLSDQQLQAKLDELEQPYLQEEDQETQHSVDHIRSLLLSKNDDNILLAIQIIEGGGFPTELIPELFIAMKFSNSKEVYQQSKKILSKYLGTKGKKSIQRTLNLAEHMQEHRLTKNLKKYTQGIDDLDGIAIAKVLYESYGKGMQYLWKYSKDPDYNKKIIEDHLEGDSFEITDKGLTILPKELADYPQITKVNISKNQFKSVPKVLTKLPNLTHLNISKNYYIKTVSPTLFKITTLKVLEMITFVRYWEGHKTQKFQNLCQVVPLERLVLRRWNRTYLPKDMEEKLQDVLGNCTVEFKP